MKTSFETTGINHRDIMPRPVMYFNRKMLVDYIISGGKFGGYGRQRRSLASLAYKWHFCPNPVHFSLLGRQTADFINFNQKPSLFTNN